MNAEELKKAQKAYLDETIAHFNLNNRATTGHRCVYSSTTTSEGCAIGRKIADKSICALLDSDISVSAGSGVSNPKVFQKLPKELKDLGAAFLTSIQQLHDHECNWGSKGLSEVGGMEVAAIRMRYNL
jgi:hypothetical protein